MTPNASGSLTIRNWCLVLSFQWLSFTQTQCRRYSGSRIILFDLCITKRFIWFDHGIHSFPWESHWIELEPAPDSNGNKIVWQIHSAESICIHTAVSQASENIGSFGLHFAFGRGRNWLEFNGNLFVQFYRSVNEWFSANELSNRREKRKRAHTSASVACSWFLPARRLGFCFSMQWIHFSIARAPATSVVHLKRKHQIKLSTANMNCALMAADRGKRASEQASGRVHTAWWNNEIKTKQ